mmetsp:Transcript_107878/g.343818  ORF Transcript_107878/g.343818 Transcript_107878/m.343818 type:complete len:362 (+) Transcript_107878:123-1208(+)
MGAGASSRRQVKYAAGPALAAPKASSDAAVKRRQQVDFATDVEESLPLADFKSLSESPNATIRSMPGHVDLDVTRWHMKNCVQTDLCQAWAIRDAFDFDANDRKEVSKNVRLSSVGDGAHRNYGRTSRLYPVKINCDACGTFIQDRQGTKPFYFCWRCRRAKRSLLLCVSCYEAGAVSPPTMRASRRAWTIGIASNNSGEALAVLSGNLRTTERSKSVGVVSRIPSGIEEEGSRSYPMTKIISSEKSGFQVDIPSGTWKGEIEEKTMRSRSRRKATRELRFHAGGSLTGTCDEGCQVAGHFTFRGTAKGRGLYDVTWVETHAWGQLTVVAELSVASPLEAMIDGSFSASDGGKGLLGLTFP